MISLNKIGGVVGRYKYSSMCSWSGCFVSWLAWLLALLGFLIILLWKILLAWSLWSPPIWCWPKGNALVFMVTSSFLFLLLFYQSLRLNYNFLSDSLCIWSEELIFPCNDLFFRANLDYFFKLLWKLVSFFLFFLFVCGLLECLRKYFDFLVVKEILLILFCKRRKGFWFQGEWEWYLMHSFLNFLQVWDGFSCVLSF